MTTTPQVAPPPDEAIETERRFRSMQSQLGGERRACARFDKPSDERALRRVAEIYRRVPWATGNVSTLDALFLYDMVQGVRPEYMIEVGVASGCSSAVLLAALADAGVHPSGLTPLQGFDISGTCYFDPARRVGSAAAELVPHLARGLTLHTPRIALDAGEMFASRPTGLVFIDADHRHPWPTLDLLAMRPALKPGAWVVLHDIRLPDLQLARAARTGNAPQWMHHGAKWLFELWPFEKFCEQGEWTNTGAIRIPEDRPVLAADLRHILDRQHEVGADAALTRAMTRCLAA